MSTTLHQGTELVTSSTTSILSIVGVVTISGGVSPDLDTRVFVCRLPVLISSTETVDRIHGRRRTSLEHVSGVSRMSGSREELTLGQVSGSEGETVALSSP